MEHNLIPKFENIKRRKFSKELMLSLNKPRNYSNQFIKDFIEKIPELFTSLPDTPENLKKNIWTNDPNDAFLLHNTAIIKNRNVSEKFGGKKRIIPPAPFTNSRYADNPHEPVWYYIDELDIIQGPFTSAEMDFWLGNGYFFHELLIRFKENNNFVKLIDLFGNIESVSLKDIEEKPVYVHVKQMKRKASNDNPKENIPLENLCYPERITQSLTNLDEIIHHITNAEKTTCNIKVNTFEGPKIDSKFKKDILEVNEIKKSDIPKNKMSLAYDLSKIQSTNEEINLNLNVKISKECKISKENQILSINEDTHTSNQLDSFFSKKISEEQVFNTTSIIDIQNPNNQQGVSLNMDDHENTNKSFRQGNLRQDQNDFEVKIVGVSKTKNEIPSIIAMHPENKVVSIPITDDLVNQTTMASSGIKPYENQAQKESIDIPEKTLSHELDEPVELINNRKAQDNKKKQSEGRCILKTKQSGYESYSAHGVHQMVVYVPKSQINKSSHVEAKTFLLNDIKNLNIQEAQLPLELNQQIKIHNKVEKQAKSTKTNESKNSGQILDISNIENEGNKRFSTKVSKKKKKLLKKNSEVKTRAELNKEENKISTKKFDEVLQSSSNKPNLANKVANINTNNPLFGENFPKNPYRQKKQMKTYVLKDIQPKDLSPNNKDSCQKNFSFVDLSSTKERHELVNLSGLIMDGNYSENFPSLQDIVANNYVVIQRK